MNRDEIIKDLVNKWIKKGEKVKEFVLNKIKPTHNE